jgi:small subunit ribosomal protein S13
MPRIAGTNIPEQKQIEISLTHVYGIGRSLSRKILKDAGINPKEKTSDLKAEEINKLRDAVEKKYATEGDLRRRVASDIKRLKEIGCWRGTRHYKSLPVRGQRTKTNSRTVRGNVRKTVGSGKKPAPEAT